MQASSAPPLQVFPGGQLPRQAGPTPLHGSSVVVVVVVADMHVHGSASWAAVHVWPTGQLPRHAG
jgi:hypothetical protein